MSEGAGVLGRIVAATRARVHEQRRIQPLDRLLASAPTPAERRPFAKALTGAAPFKVIAEFKRRSPSRGVLREDLTPIGAAQAYEIAGATALSILTEEEHFGGSMADLTQARTATMLPVLRKDFIVDAYQVWEGWIGGADAILLIVAALSDAEPAQLHAAASEARLDALVEVHDKQDLERALAVDARLVGVNNRDLRTLDVRLETSLELADAIPDDVVAVSESGIKTGGDLRRLRDAGFDGFLIGEHLMLAPDPGAALEELLKDAAPGHPLAPGRGEGQG
jgi:indole-3-glycerol phosphate synthase